MFVIPLLWVLFGIAAVIVASQRNRSGCAWFALGFLLGPFGLLFVLLLPPLPSAASPPSESPASRTLSPSLSPQGDISLDQETKKCPHCAEIIKLEAKKCRFCGEVFDPVKVTEEVAARREELKREYDLLTAGRKRCPFCGAWDVTNAFRGDGSFGPWCPHCQKTVGP
jgi:hypothetical protein